jgi:leucine dehydrogenase
MTPFDLADFDGHEAVHFFSDAGTGLEAIIAIHSTALGAAAGGCRYWTYQSRGAALIDALRLSRGMSYKNAMAGLPFGGGKAVVLKRPGLRSESLFKALGRAIDSLGGSYITAEDVGTTVADMQAVAGSTPSVSGLMSAKDVAGGNPSPKTAYGVFISLQAAWRYLTATDLAGVRVAVQGLGGVGFDLCKRLHQAGARLFVSDMDADRVQRAQQEFGAMAVLAEVILSTDVDILAPCALGAILNAGTIPRISARLIAGGANNQLAAIEDGERLRQAGTLYAPDYIVNAGGIICVASEYLGEGSEDEVWARIEQIPITLRTIFEQAAAESLLTNVVSDRMAQGRLLKSARPGKGGAATSKGAQTSNGRDRVVRVDG